MAHLSLKIKMGGSSSSSSTVRDDTFKSLKILCFGGSLTSGYHRESAAVFDIEHEPYGPWLEKHISTFLSRFDQCRDIDLKVTVVGLDGWKSTDLLGYLGKTLFNPKCEEFIDPSTLDLACVLCGTNDIGTIKPTKQTTKAIRSIHQMFHKHRIDTVAITVPEAGDAYERIDPLRDELNAWILGDLSKMDRVVSVFDLCSAIPQLSEPSEETRSLLWCDGLHLTPKGYRCFADRLFEQSVKPYLMRRYSLVKDETDSE